MPVPFVRDWYLNREFLKGPPACRGIYASFAEALAAVPRGKLAGYDHATAPEFYRQNLDELNPGDYPVLFWLSRLLPQAQSVFELGGTVGRGYYAYRRYLPFPSSLRWTICDTPEAVRIGSEIARQRKESALEFTTQRKPAGRPDIYATFGTLQYIEEPFAQILRQLPAPPPHLLINRVSLYEGAGFITLQNTGPWVAPYRVENQAGFIQSLCALGYELVDHWKIQRPSPNRFLMPLAEPKPAFQGMYLRLK